MVGGFGCLSALLKKSKLGVNARRTSEALQANVAPPLECRGDRSNVRRTQEQHCIYLMTAWNSVKSTSFYRTNQ